MLMEWTSFKKNKGTDLIVQLLMEFNIVMCLKGVIFSRNKRVKVIGQAVKWKISGELVQSTVKCYDAKYTRVSDDPRGKSDDSLKVK